MTIDTSIASSGSATEAASEREIVLTRLLDAPRELVFKVWTDPKHVEKWWGPHGFTIAVHEMNVQPGGNWRFLMQSAEHGNFPNKIVYREIVAPERLVFEHGADEANKPWHFHLVTVTFDEEAGKTRLTMRMRFATAEEREQTVAFGAVELGYQTLDKLAAHLAQI